ncbi:MAG: gliding motility-associated C-terminal domain-containing protein [Cyclobacteriaceae bacterium]|jgi:gliding motility-associated-like protein|nr:gliding motility-associated C-terminal domain-containing protein [Cyclobacteriaceae bacterium]
MKTRISYALFFLISCFIVATQSHAQISSTFTINAQGWTTPDDADGTIGYSATGGNPGGFVFGNPFVIVLGATTLYVPFYFVAPATYHGNRNTYYNGTLRYDIQQSSTGVPNLYAEVIIGNSGGVTLYYFPTTSNQPSVPPGWSTYSVVLNNALGFWKTTNSATGPAASETLIQGVLGDLARLEIRGLYRDANTTNRLDNVTFTPPIVVTTQPTSAVVCEGTTINFATSAIGNPAITYQWQRESSPSVWTDLTNSGGYSNVTTATMTVNTTGNFGAGLYRCRISGTAVVDAFSNVATLTINLRPNAPPSSGAARCGPGALTLTASGGTAGQYRWYTVPTGGTAITGQTNATYTTPSISTTTTYYVAINNGTCESNRTAVIATINTPPNAPPATGSANCGPGALTLTASGGTAGQYRWYTVPTGGTAITGQTNATYTTPSISTTTTYYVAINNGTCESNRTAVVATINTLPSPPTATGATSCAPASVTLSAVGGTSGQYRWYTTPTGGTPLSGQTASTFVTPLLTTSTTFYVAITDGTCESTRTPAVAAIAQPGCDNVPPMIQTEPLITQIAGQVIIDLVPLIRDDNNNLVLSSLRIVAPPASGAPATIDASFRLIIDYSSVAFSGTESITIEVCDAFAACTQETFSIEVVGDIEIFNAISANQDNRNESLRIEHITALSATRQNQVLIYNRWGDLVWDGTNYDNETVVFTGRSNQGEPLPTGTYFYKIVFQSGRPAQTGYLQIR